LGALDEIRPLPAFICESWKASIWRFLMSFATAGWLCSTWVGLQRIFVVPQIFTLCSCPRVCVELQCGVEVEDSWYTGPRTCEKCCRPRTMWLCDSKSDCQCLGADAPRTPYLSCCWNESSPLFTWRAPPILFCAWR
jgi:hypothetical protein